MKILVTGGAGYIGSVLTEELIENNFTVSILDNLSKGSKKLINPHAQLFEKDLLDMPSLNQIFKEENFDLVIHLAAYSEVGESFKNPQEYNKNNLEGTKTLIKVMKNHNCKNIIFSSTAAVYGEPNYLPIDENHDLNPISPYGKSKLEAENEIINSNINYCIFRFFNVGGASNSSKYGEIHDPETHLIPNLLKAIKNNKTFYLFGNDYPTKDGTCIRDYVHVIDLCSAHLKAIEIMEKENFKEIINLSSKNGYSVKEIIDLTEKSCHKKVKLKIEERRKGDPEKLIASFQKAEKILGWKAKKSITEIINSAWKFEQNQS